MKKLIILIFFSSFWGSPVLALDVEKFRALTIDVSQGEITLYRHESMFLGFLCESGLLSKLTDQIQTKNQVCKPRKIFGSIFLDTMKIHYAMMDFHGRGATGSSG